MRDTEIEYAYSRMELSRSTATAWLIDHIDLDGKPIGAEEGQCYYRLPWSLVECGEIEIAGNVLTWIAQNALTPTGDLQAGLARRGFELLWASYPLSIIAIGAQSLGASTLANRIMELLEAEYVDHTSGGAYSERPEKRLTGRQDLFPTAQLGTTALATDRPELASGAFRFLQRLFDAQPSLPHRLYTTWLKDSLHTSLESDEEFDSVTDFRRSRQAFYNPGIAATFLGKYYLYAGDPDALTLGASYLRLTQDGTEAQFDYTESKQVCKFAWGCAVLSETPGGEQYTPDLVRMAHWFADCQEEDGHWENSRFLVPRPTSADNLTITTEFALHVSTLKRTLGRIVEQGSQVPSHATEKG
jgi:hypothetical protein